MMMSSRFCVRCVLCRFCHPTKSQKPTRHFSRKPLVINYSHCSIIRQRHMTTYMFHSIMERHWNEHPHKQRRKGWHNRPNRQATKDIFSSKSLLSSSKMREKLFICTSSLSVSAISNVTRKIRRLRPSGYCSVDGRCTPPKTYQSV